MPIERISRYKASPRLGFNDKATEQKFSDLQQGRGRSTSIFSLATLMLVSLGFFLLEFLILGLNSLIPMYAYLGIALLSALISLYGVFSSNTAYINLRILIPGAALLAVLLMAVYFEGYRLYHAVEMSLLVIWLGSLNILRFRLAALISVVSLAGFAAVAWTHGATELKLSGLLSLQAATLIIAVYLSYMLERSRRMMFLTSEALESVYNRQESWAFALIDMDMTLSGITNFEELISRLMEQIKSAIEFDSFILTSLKGKGSKPLPDEMEGTLFEQEDQTLWPDELLTKLTQTRQATTSSIYDTKKGFLGREKQIFQHFRLDLPVMNDSTLMGVISLRRQSGPFDDLDMTASVSLASQAMLIFNRSLNEIRHQQKLKQVQADAQAKIQSIMDDSDDLIDEEKARPKAAPSPINIPKKTVSSTPKSALQTAQTPVPEIKKVEQAPEARTIQPSKAIDEVEEKESSSPSIDLDMTMDPITASRFNAHNSTGEESVMSREMLDELKQKEVSAKKTITLLSRENADKIALDRYRTAAVEGEPLSLLLVEVDGLSSVREREGDQVAYKIFAGVVKYVFSKTDKEKDVLGRYGQNGFSVLLPRVDMNAAERFAESIRVYTEGAKFKTPVGERSATLSIGVASITDETGNHEAMVKRADMALFVAKKNGRNCVKVRL